MVPFLAANPLLVIFLVIGIGYPLGRVRIGGVRLGLATVLFVGLGFGALAENMGTPELVYMLGLVLFVYTTGLSSGSEFLEAMHQHGGKANLLTLGGLLLAAGLAALSAFWPGLGNTTRAGMFAGATTNTPALAAVIDMIKAGASPAILGRSEAEPVIAYSLTYPLGVLGMILVLIVLQRLWKVKATPVKKAPDLEAVTVKVAYPEPVRVARLMGSQGWDVVFSRRKRAEGAIELVTGETVLFPGDLVTVVGAHETLLNAVPFLGEIDENKLDFDLSQLDRRRIILSNARIAGGKVQDLQLSRDYGVLVTRVRRGDIDFIPHGNTQVVLGDQLTLVGSAKQIAAAAAFLGDSYRAISEVDLMTLGLGIVLGVLVGSIPVPLPGGGIFHLGLAGGTLIVSLLLGALKRTGPIMWYLPYGANLTLRQAGLVIFLAGIGTRSGYVFADTLLHGGGLFVVLCGALITVSMSAAVLYVGYRRLHLPFGFLSGLLAGMQTQPAVLSFALEQYGDEAPALGYATVYPLAMILKIVLAQALVMLR